MPRPPAQRHTLKIDLPKGLLAKFGGETLAEGIPKARIAGAVVAGVGAYLLVRTTQKIAGDIVRTTVGAATGLFETIFNVTTGGIFGGRLKPGILAPAFTREQEQLFAADPFAISIGLITGGMILAGQNPGEILKGIGEIIPG